MRYKIRFFRYSGVCVCISHAEVLAWERQSAFKKFRRRLWRKWYWSRRFHLVPILPVEVKVLSPGVYKADKFVFDVFDLADIKMWEMRKVLSREDFKWYEWSVEAVREQAIKDGWLMDERCYSPRHYRGGDL